MTTLVAENITDELPKDLQKALDAADKGVFVSHEAVEKWVMSMGTKLELPRPKADVFKNA